jgi:hypothetical protein
MQKLGAEKYIEKENCIIFPTICHNTDVSTASMKLYYYKENKYFYCYTECEGMSIFKFLETYYKTRSIDYDWYEDIYSLVVSCSFYEPKKSGETSQLGRLSQRYEINKFNKLTTYPKQLLNVFTTFYTPEWLSDNISIDSMEKYDIKYSIPQNKIIIPHYNINNELVGIRGRALDEVEVEVFGKYMPVKIEQTWYKHPLSLNLYGLNITKDTVKKERICYIFESEKSCLQVDGFDIPNCSAAVCGSSFNKNQLKLLIKHCQPQEIVICFDKEEKPNEDKYFNKLWRMGEKYSQYCNFSFVYDRENLLSDKDSPSDKGEEVFKELLKRRVIIK